MNVMASLTEASFDGIFKKGKKIVAADIQFECLRSERKEDHKLLNHLLDNLLDPRKPISDAETIDWIRWLLASGRTPDEFAELVKQYDNATTCGLVWTANFVAYRCRTCGISPCMSLCAECFQKGDHEGHDFNMFRSQAGGACDCGDPSVMKESGFCVRHGPGVGCDKPSAPQGLLCVAQTMLPRLLHRLVIQLRKNTSDAHKEADSFITNILTKMTDMGAAMRTIMSDILISQEIYSSLANKCDSEELEISGLLHERYQSYNEAKKKMTTFKPPYYMHKDCTVCDKSAIGWVINAFEKDLTHSSFAEEFLFWTIVYQFPQKLVCFLLNMLPDSTYKAAFAESFVHHYSRVSLMLARFRNLDDGSGHSLSRPSPHDLLSNCVVHVSVQLFSNEPLAAKLCRDQHLLHVIIASLRATIEGSGAGDDVRGILVNSRLQSSARNRHMVVRCDHYIMRKHSYWPLVSDLNNILTHNPVAMIFMNDLNLLEMWLEFILNFQAMNLNVREFDEHVEYENESYYAAFSAELEICATPVWTLISHLKTPDTAHLTKQVILTTRNILDGWFEKISMTNYDVPNAYHITFHIPLHRYYSIFLHHGVAYQNLSLDALLPPTEAQLQLYIAHPLQVLIGFFEILCGLWVRNGLQMKGQAMTYIQCHFCNSMVDPDLFLIQQCASKLSPDWFIETVFKRFHVWEWLSFSHSKESPYPSGSRSFLEPDQVMPMLEGALTFLSTFFAVRTNIGLSDEEITRQEMVTLLAMSDRTHSQLMELLPEKCGTTAHNKDFETILSQIADYRAPTLESGGNLSQGMFYPKSEIWEKEYDPLHVLLRAVHRRDYQSSMDRFTTYVKQSGKSQTKSLPWPPFRLPPDADRTKFTDPRKLLYSKVLHGVLFSILHKALYVCDVSDQVLALTVYLIEMALSYPSPEETSPAPTIDEMRAPVYVQDQKYADWFSSEWILLNMNTSIQIVTLANSVNGADRAVVSPTDDRNSPSVEEMEVDIHSSSDENDNDQYMSADEGFDVDDEVQMGIEAAPEQPSLPSSNVPLALLPPSPTEPPTGTTPITALVPRANHTLSNLQTATPPANDGTLSVPTPGPSTSPNVSSTAVMLRSPMQMLVRGTARRHRRRGRILQPQRFLDCFREAQSAPAGSLGLNGELVCARSNSSNSLTHAAVPINESMLSMLIKLHSKLTNESDSLRVGPVDESRMGDGPHFISRIVNLYAKLNAAGGAKAINGWRQRLWPKQMPSNSSLFTNGDGEGSGTDSEDTRNKSKEERRRVAKERQKKLMAEFACKQKAFMKKMEAEGENDKCDIEVDTDGTSSNEENTQSDKPSFIKTLEYDCVICGHTCPSTLDRLIGMVALLQSTSVLAHCKPRNKPYGASADKENDSNVLPCDDNGIEQHTKRVTYANYMEDKIDVMSHNFNPGSWLNALSIGWEGGVHVQTCGHFIHLDCHKSYMLSLRTQGSRHSLDQNEYSCPFCRQMANSVLPINPEIGSQAAVVHCRPNDYRSVSEELVYLLSSNRASDGALIKLLGPFMEDLTKATPPQFRSVRTNPTTQSLFLFLCSIVRTNVETEVLVKLSHSTPTGAKKVCFLSLFHVLALNAKVFIQSSYSEIWSQLTGLAPPDDQAMSLTQLEKEVPLLLKDPTALLIQLLFAMPLNIDKAYFSCIVQMLYNLNFAQALAQLTCLMTDEERAKFKEQYLTDLKDSRDVNDSFLRTLPTFIGYLIDIFEHSSLYLHLDDEDTVGKVWSTRELYESAKSTCLPFLRAAAVLQSHLYADDFPDAIAKDRDNEFIIIKNFLNLHEDVVSVGDPTLGCVFWPSAEPGKVIRTWCQEFMQLVQKSLLTSRKLLRNKPVALEVPTLLRLPHTYDQLFLFYHKRTCKTCDRIPKEPCICLVCGSLVCMRENCCRSTTSSTLEAVSHSEICGAGTAIYLAINSSTIIVIRGKRACVWGSVYLDSFGEEDRDLKRGKPLYLSAERYRVLEQQWLTHSFDHTSKRWVWHKETL